MRHIFLRLVLLSSLIAITVIAIAVIGLDKGVTINAYRAMKRELADYRLSTSMSSVPCPQKAFVVLGVGQSNAANHIEGMTGADQDAKAYSFFYGRCYLISDPLPGATGKMGSLWSLFAQRLAKQMNRPVVVIAGGAASSSLKDWHVDTVGMFSRVVRRLREARSRDLRPELVLWHHGETDSLAKMTEETYRDLLEQLIEKFQVVMAGENGRSARTKLPMWLVFQVSRCWNEASVNEEIRSAQRAVAAGNERVSLGPDTDTLGEGYRYDGCHFNAAGRERIVTELLARAVDMDLINDPVAEERKP